MRQTKNFIEIGQCISHHFFCKSHGYEIVLKVLSVFNLKPNNAIDVIIFIGKKKIKLTTAMNYC